MQPQESNRKRLREAEGGMQEGAPSNIRANEGALGRNMREHLLLPGHGFHSKV